MAADRQVPTSATPGAVLGDPYMDAVSEEITKLYDISHITLGTVGGTADVITAVAVPALVGALVDGMKFTLPTGGGANTTAATLNIDGTARDIVRNDGSATQADDLPASSRVPLEYDSANGRFVILHPPRAAQGADLNYQTFTSSGTWTKPSGLSNDARVRVEAWGGGGGGYSGGGGGGAYAWRELRAGDLGATETVTVGSGGVAGASSTAGGNSSFGAHLTAYGGGAGKDNYAGAGGGGWSAAGSDGAGSNVGGAGGGPGAGGGGTSASGSDSYGFGGGGGGGGSGTNGGSSNYGGGGGGTISGAGGSSVYGGGGGGATAGASIYGGAGGATDIAGSAPGGGGGVISLTGGAGARGEVRVWVVG